MQQLIKFEKWVKIRIGEPITAIDLTEDTLVFGSISGYVGFYSIPKQDLKYIQEIFDEIIRGIHIRPDRKAYISVGDYQGLIMDIEKKEWSTIKYEKRAHNPTVCSSTLAMLKKEFVALLTVAPTQNKDLVIDISTKKNSLFLVDLSNSDMTHFHIEMPPLCVPFDFDGQRILLLEYLKGGKKRLQIYDFKKSTLQHVFDIPNRIEFVSHGRLIKNFIIYVEDHKKIKCLDLRNLKETLLFSMDSTVIAFDTLDLSQDQPKLDEESKSQLPNSELIGDITQIQISALDYYAQLKTYLNGKITYNFNLLKYIYLYDLFYERVANVHADLVQHKYIFDMGYPYYLQVRQNKVAATSDMGILVFTI